LAWIEKYGKLFGVKSEGNDRIESVVNNFIKILKYIKAEKE
jgi:hypothetical protein